MLFYVSFTKIIKVLKLEFSRVARYARSELGFAEVLVWNDMFGHIGVDLLHEYQMGELVIPVIWGYAVDVTELNYFPTNMFHRYSQVGIFPLTVATYSLLNSIINHSFNS